jgi:uncharacterized protein
MKLTRETGTTYLIRGWEPGVIHVDEDHFTGHLIIGAEQLIADWNPPAVKDLSVESLAPALALQPGILLLGTGPEVSFPDADLAGLLAIDGIGLEIMATPAACRTFNVLTVEGRPVVAALINGINLG